VLQSAFADRVDNGDPCKSYICHDCNRTFKHPGNFKQHMASHNKPVVTHPPNMPPLPLSPGGGLKRPVPGLVKMDEPEERLAKRLWECPECEQKFAIGKELQTHMKSLHNIEMVLPPGASEMEEERAVSPPIGDADEGMKALALAAGADRLSMFNCEAPGCFQSFTTEGWLARHRSRSHADLGSQANGSARVYSCNQCGKEFFKLSKLTQHVKTHSPEVHYKYPCDICGKKFTRPQHVTRHKLLHTGERPHTCPRDNCDKSFAREDKLKHHLIKGCLNELDQSIDSR
jgi:DNA-directed RNA polymerase subunit RPC12/RpoP